MNQFVIAPVRNAAMTVPMPITDRLCRKMNEITAENTVMITSTHIRIAPKDLCILPEKAW